MKNYIVPFISLLGILCFYSCAKEGPGGKAGIRGVVRHHESTVPNATVHIGYGSTEARSTVSDYDQFTTADSTASFVFTNLTKGDYFIYAIGFDKTTNVELSGGVAIEIKKKTSVIDVAVPVFGDH